MRWGEFPDTSCSSKWPLLGERETVDVRGTEENISILDVIYSQSISDNVKPVECVAEVVVGPWKVRSVYYLKSSQLMWSLSVWWRTHTVRFQWVSRMMKTTLRCKLCIDSESGGSASNTHFQDGHLSFSQHVAAIDITLASPRTEIMDGTSVFICFSAAPPMAVLIVPRIFRVVMTNFLLESERRAFNAPGSSPNAGVMNLAAARISATLPRASSRT